jgi:hypothetical protein
MPKSSPSRARQSPAASTLAFNLSASLLLLAAIAAAVPAPAPAQTLARPGLAGSGLNSDPWWTHAVFYRTGDSSPDADFKAVATQLDALQALGIDALIVRRPSRIRRQPRARRLRRARPSGQPPRHPRPDRPSRHRSHPRPRRCRPVLAQPRRRRLPRRHPKCQPPRGRPRPSCRPCAKSPTPPSDSASSSPTSSPAIAATNPGRTARRAAALAAHPTQSLPSCRSTRASRISTTSTPPVCAPCSSSPSIPPRLRPACCSTCVRRRQLLTHIPSWQSVDRRHPAHHSSQRADRYRPYHPNRTRRLVPAAECPAPRQRHASLRQHRHTQLRQSERIGLGQARSSPHCPDAAGLCALQPVCCAGKAVPRRCRQGPEATRMVPADAAALRRCYGPAGSQRCDLATVWRVHRRTGPLATATHHGKS